MNNWTKDFTAFANASLTKREREILQLRGVTDNQINLYQIGYVNTKLPKDVPEHFSWWSNNGVKLNDVFVFPLTTTLGAINGFQFRHVVREQKGYIDYFVDRKEPCTFGLSQAVKAVWDSQSVFLVEGAFDLFPIQRAVPYTIATLTASVNGQLVRLLRRLVKKVWLGYDADATGKSGCEEFKKRYGDEFEVYIMKYPMTSKTVKDFGELWETWGDSKLIPYIRSEIEQNQIF